MKGDSMNVFDDVIAKEKEKREKKRQEVQAQEAKRMELFSAAANMMRCANLGQYKFRGAGSVQVNYLGAQARVWVPHFGKNLILEVDKSEYPMLIVHWEMDKNNIGQDTRLPNVACKIFFEVIAEYLEL